ncbi:MAG: heme ABC transporter ATP-binding protein [Pseudomonadota bacterium]
MLRVNKLTVSAQGVRLLDNVSCQLNGGEVLAIIGPNGAGKTTLLNTILNQVHPGQHVQGSIEACGKAFTQWSPKMRARHMALLPQLSLLNFPYTVAEVIQLGRIPHQSGKTIDQEIVNEALVALDIVHLKQRLYTQLSGGEKQRVQLARVMTQIWREQDARQRLLLLDEPTSSLDLGHQQRFMEQIRCFANQGVAIVIIAHDINLVSHYADYVLALACGHVLAQGQAQQVIQADLINSLYQVNTKLIAHPDTQNSIVVFR